MVLLKQAIEVLLHAFPVVTGSMNVIGVKIEYNEEDVLHLDDEEMNAKEHGYHEDEEKTYLDED